MRLEFALLIPFYTAESRSLGIPAIAARKWRGHAFRRHCMAGYLCCFAIFAFGGVPAFGRTWLQSRRQNNVHSVIGFADSQARPKAGQKEFRRRRRKVMKEHK